jgi:hypothetical protein
MALVRIAQVMFTPVNCGNILQKKNSVFLKSIFDLFSSMVKHVHLLQVVCFIVRKITLGHIKQWQMERGNEKVESTQ